MSSGCPLRDVIDSCTWVASQSKHVHVDKKGISRFCKRFDSDQLKNLCGRGNVDEEIHLTENDPITAQYLLVVDCLNFCFWPDVDLEYEHLALGVKEAISIDRDALSAEYLAGASGEDVQRLIGWDRPVPEQEERARLLREVGKKLLSDFGGEASNLILKAEKSASKLVNLICMHFPGFRDHAIYKGRQVFFYKRAQIFVGDLWGAYRGQGLGEFHDIDKLTMFADYRVPVVLKGLGFMHYTEDLEQRVRAQVEIPSGSEEEVEIRAASIVVVAKIRKAMMKAHGKSPHCVQLDWWLWEMGEAKRDLQPPHHTTRTIYY